jgi:succinate dehydrogenase / fumarate reductase, membrane anchor subunit
MSIQRPTRSGSPEYYLWLFTRLSAVLMLFVGAGGILYANLFGRTLMDAPAQYRWAFFPIYWHVQNTDVPDVFPMWSNAFWRVYCAILVSIAILHGFNGLRVVVEDYIHRPLPLLFVRGAVMLLSLFVFGAAVVIIFEWF